MPTPGGGAAQILQQPLRIVRIGDVVGHYVILDTTGSGKYPGRWNTNKSPVLYTSEHFSTAMLEKLVHFGRVGLPPPFNQYYTEGVIPPGCTYEMPDLLDPSMHGWTNNPSSSPPWTVSQQCGEDWYLSQRSLGLIVPSLPASTIESNIVINTNHPEYSKYVVWAGRSGRVHWDHRLFGVWTPAPVHASSHVAGPPGTHKP